MGCCGQSTSSPHRATQAAAVPGETWDVHFPNGAIQPYDEEWKANAAKAVGPAGTEVRRRAHA